MKNSILQVIDETSKSKIGKLGWLFLKLYIFYKILQYIIKKFKIKLWLVLSITLLFGDKIALFFWNLPFITFIRELDINNMPDELRGFRALILIAVFVGGLIYAVQDNNMGGPSDFI